MSVAKHWALVESVVVCAKYSKTPEIIDILHMQTRLNYGFFRGFWSFPSFFLQHINWGFPNLEPSPDTPVIVAMALRTWSNDLDENWGERKPYIIAGGLECVG